MKLYTLIVLLLFVSYSSEAQKIRFTDKRNQWVYRDYGDPDAAGACFFFVVKTWGNDTTIGGTVYQKMMDSVYMLNMECRTAFTPVGKHLFIISREDTIANKVYILNQADLTEHVLFDYNLHLGDTVTKPCYFSYAFMHTDSVVYVDSTLIGGTYHKVWMIDNHGTGGIRGQSYTITEGIGTYDEVRYPLCAQIGEYPQQLLCFSQNGYYPVINGPRTWGYFDPLYIDTFRNSVGCVVLSTDDIHRQTSEISLYPNPGYSTINFKGNALTRITITNTIGQVMNKVFPGADSYDLSIAHLPAGLYFADIIYGDERNLHVFKKFIKQ